MIKDRFVADVMEWHNYGLGSVRITDMFYRLNFFSNVYEDYLERDISKKPKAWKTIYNRVEDIIKGAAQEENE